MKTNRRPNRIIINHPMAFIGLMAMIIVSASVLTSVGFFSYMVMADKVVMMETHVAEVQKKDSEISKLEKEVANIAQVKDKEIKKYQTLAKETQTKLDMVNKQADYLVNKYYYYYKDRPKNSTVDLSQLALIDKRGKETNINPHTVVMLMKVESTWNNTSEDTTGASNSKGYGQFLGSTGKFVYKKLLQRGGEYNHRVLVEDPHLSIDMIYTYLNYQLKGCDGNMRQALINYNGSYRKEAYAQSIENLMKSNGLGSFKTPTYR